MSDERTLEYQGGGTQRFSTAWLRVVSAGGEITVKLEERLVLGSREGAGLRLDDRLVSRVHAELELRDDGVWVKDLGSRNGTFVEGVRVESARVPSGGSLTVGGAQIVVDVGFEERPVWKEDRFGPLWGKSPKMRELFHRLARVARSDASALIRGETGTGKELVARALHEASPRANRPFIVVDCGALPANLLESELFGHARGAFTGAIATHLGAVEVAEEGTIFLDEIGELPLDLQPKLLRALESRTYRRLGETQYRPINARFLTATHRDLASMVNAGTFREDLFFRLNVLPIHVPPLRERKDDIPLLVEHMLRSRNAPPLDVRPAELAARPWPGNVRELRSFVERAITLGTEEALEMSPAAERTPPAQLPSSGFPPVDHTIPFKDVRDAWNDHLERTYIIASLAQHGGNVAAVAEASGLARSYVYRLIQKHNLGH